MACINPPELSELELLMAVDGEANGKLSRHLETCPHCRARAENLARLQATLSARLFRSDCPSSLALGNYHLGLLSAAEAAPIARHVADCPYCRQELDQLQRFLAQDALVGAEVFAALQRRTKQVAARLVGGARAVGDRLASAGSLAPALTGLRGEFAEPLRYVTDDLQITLDVQPDPDQPDHRALIGLVLGLPPAAQAEVALWQEDRPVARTAVDELGNFVLAAVPQGVFDLWLTTPDLEVQVQGLAVA